MGLLIGLDLGTTNTKAVAFDPARGEVVAVAARPTPYVEVAPGTREIDPLALWEETATCLRIVMSTVREPILAVGIASMAEAGIPLGAKGAPLYNIIPWYDPRTEPQLQQALALLSPARLFQITGQATRNVYTLFKILWLREHAPDVIARLWRWLSVSDFVAWKLTEATATDFTLASRTMLFDQRERRWSQELLALAGLRENQLPTLVPSGHIVGTVNTSAAAVTGLPEGVGVGIGGHDHLCGALAAGIVEPGQVGDSIGTAESLVIPVDRFQNDNRLPASRVCCYAHVTGEYAVQAGITLSGGSLAWLASQLYATSKDPVGAAMAAAATAPVGAGSLFYFPYLGGNGAPVGDENVSACFIGLRPTHERSDLVRALLEGIGFGIRHALEVISEVIGPPTPPLRAFGGGSRSPLWLQIRANILGLPVLGVEVPEAVAVGAALLAGVGIGAIPNTRVASACVRRVGTAYDPESIERDRYETLYREGYLTLYPALAPVFDRLSKL